MNLTLLANLVNDGSVLDEEDFYEKLINIFQRVIAHYESGENNGKNGKRVYNIFD
jgi:hypothetical protein